MISHNFRKLCNTSVCYEITTLSNCCFCIFLPNFLQIIKKKYSKERCVWQRKNSESPWGIKTQTFKFCAPMPYHWATESMVSEVHYKVHIWHAFFFVSRSWPDIKHLSLFLNQAQNLPSLLFYLRTILFLINRTLWHGHGLALVGK